MRAHVCATVRDINPPSMDPSGGDLPDNFMFPDTLVSTEIDAFASGPNNYVMGPRSVLYGESIEIHVVTLDHIRNRRKRGFIWGWADYNDTIGGNIRHRTEFCREIIVLHDPARRDETRIRFQTYR